MKTFSFLLTLSTVLFATVGHAQTEAPECGSGILHEELIETNEQYQRSWFNLEQSLQRMHAERSNERSDEVYTIPVVVHVIHEGEPLGTGSNISDEQVLSAIVALNEDFRKIPGTNGDGAGVDVGIEFCLAARDPEGNASTGINRVDGSVVPLYAEEGINVTGSEGADEDAVKSLSVWPREDYLNVWVVNEIENNNALNGIQGFAYFPINNFVDGVTVLHNAFGTTGNLKPNTALNRTFSHEVGHYFSLYHTFHMTDDCNSESNCNTQGDRVCDTPPTTLGGNCSSPACGGTQQVENYMDYTAESCRDMFSEGQKERMRNCLLSQRPTLLDSFGCIPVTATDIGITAVNEPDGILCSPTFTPEVYLTNFGSETLTSCTIHFNVNNVNTLTYDWTGNLASSTSTWVTLPEYTAGSGVQTFNVWTSNPNGNTDEHSPNDELSNEFNVSSGSGVDLNITLDFFGTETTWAIEQDGEVLITGGPYINNSQGTTFTESVCLPGGCYTLWMYDAYGDGQGFTNGSYELLDGDGNILAEGAGNWGLEASHAFCLEEVVSADPPSAAFNYSLDGGCEEVVADFSDQSTGDVTSWSWSFPGGSPSSSSQQNPQNIVYDSPGTYNVSLTVSNANGSDTQTLNGIIEVTQGVTVNLDVTDPTCNGLSNGAVTVNASGGSGNYTYNWNTGGSSANLANLGAGTYSVTVTDASGCQGSAEAVLIDPETLDVNVFKSDIACFGSADGSANASASGGLPPYSFNWNSGQSGASISGLEEGSYAVTVTDANECEASANIQIVEPSAISGEALLIDAETCVGQNGAAIINPLGGTGNLSIQWSNGANGNLLENVASGTYQVTVSDDNGCSIQSEVTIPYDCIEAPEASQLDVGSCTAVGLTLDDAVSCEPIDGASMYHWRFTNVAAGFFAEEYTTGNNTTFQLSNVTGLGYGLDLEVQIRVMNNENIWSDWGAVCTIGMQQTVPGTELSAADCAAEIFDANMMLTADDVTGATAYEWRFTAEDHEVILTSFLPQVTPQLNDGFIEGVSYDIAVRAQVNELFSDWSPICTLFFGSENSLQETDDQSFTMNVYPNPSAGEKIMLEFGNLLSAGSVIEIEVYDNSGKLIENNILSPVSSERTLTCKFTTRLSAGMYFLRVQSNDQVFEEKLMIR
jgi:PKD repeat protein